MAYIVETSLDAQRIVVVEHKPHAITRVLQEYAKTKDAQVIHTKSLPARPDSFALCFLIQSSIAPSDLPEYTQTPIIYLVIQNKKRAARLVQQAKSMPTRHIKVVSLERDEADMNTIEQLIWFAYNRDDDAVLLEVALSRKLEASTPLAARIIRPFRRSKRRIVLALFVLWLLFMGSIIGTLYLSARIRLAHLPTEDPPWAVQIYEGAAAVYQPVRPIFFLFSLGLTADSLANTNRSIGELHGQVRQLNLSLSALIRTALVAQSASPLDVDDAKKQLNQTIRTIDTLLNQPEWILNATTKLLGEISDTKVQLQRYARIVETIPDIFGANTSHTYALIIADDRLITTGGGQVLAVVVVRVQGGHVTSLVPYPAAVIDQTLATTLPAPESMQTFAQRSFLNTTTALTEPQLDGNAQTIQTILANERKIDNVDGYIYVTNSALAQMLGEDSLYLPQAQEKLSSDSLPIKLAAERANEAFIAEFVQSYLQYLGARQSAALLPIVDRLFLEKQLAFLTSTPSQETFADLYWDGQLITPRCVLSSDNCAVDVLGIYQTGITTNYNNLLVQQTRSLKTTIADDGTIRNQLSLTLTNDPQEIAYPAQPFESYMQLILPRNSVVESITDNAQPVEDVLSRQAGYTLIALPITIDPQQTRYIQITYTLNSKLQKKDGAYQLILQKQLGAANNDFTFELILPKSFTPIEQNFHPVVNGNRIFYNNFQSTDRIFVITLKHHS